MKKRQKAAWFLSGILTAALVSTTFSPALALFSKTIQVQSGINFYVDDRKLTPKDANGNPIEAFMYNNYTYLPVRAISEALDVPIQWDNDTKSVYIGKHTGDEPAVWVGEMDYFSKFGDYKFNSTTKDNLGKEHTHSIHLYNTYNAFGYSNFYVTYKLNERYSYLTGLFYQKYASRSEGDNSTLEIYADGESVWKATVGPGLDPVELNLNVQGVQELKFRLIGGGSCKNAAIGELGLWT